MSVFDLDKGSELLDIICAMRGGDDGVKQFIREFSDWVDLCYDSDSDENWTEVDNSDTTDDDDDDESIPDLVDELDVVVNDEGEGHISLDLVIDESSDEEESITVAEEIWTQKSKDGFYSLK